MKNKLIAVCVMVLMGVITILSTYYIGEFLSKEGVGGAYVTAFFSSIGCWLFMWFIYHLIVFLYSEIMSFLEKL